MMNRIARLQSPARDFAPDILRVQGYPPSPLPRLVLWALAGLLALLLIWAAVGRLDEIAVAQGKIVPLSYLQVVQPAEPGIVRELLVKEGDEVRAGQALVRMDSRISEAERTQIRNDLSLRTLQLRRIDAELGGTVLKRGPDDPAELFAQVDAQHRARRRAHEDALGIERDALAKARADFQAALETEAKLRQTLPLYREQEQGWKQLAKEDYAGKLLAMDRSRARIEVEQELKVQSANVAALRATIAQAGKRIAQIASSYRQQLHDERIEAEGQRLKLQQEWEKQSHRHGLLELRAPQDGVVKDLATHTPGTVVAPGTVVLTLVPHNDPMQAEVWVSNLDAGFVQERQPVKLKLAAYPFQKYGMVEGEVRQISPDASEYPAARGDRVAAVNDAPPAAASGYRALVALRTPFLEAGAARHRIVPGMQVSAEIHLGSRSVLEYLLPPVQKTLHEAGRER
ncbi:MAG: HlyD family type I secretion periplasmic adaptor subunit [Betaproteobacteria bacterium]|nr:HlyD family type I secretion periplasmic adaptor subunit [Betaproteobacteria bacterium]